MKRILCYVGGLLTLCLSVRLLSQPSPEGAPPEAGERKPQSEESADSPAEESTAKRSKESGPQVECSGFSLGGEQQGEPSPVFYMSETPFEEDKDLVGVSDELLAVLGQAEAGGSIRGASPTMAWGGVAYPVSPLPPSPPAEKQPITVEQEQGRIEEKLEGSESEVVHLVKELSAIEARLNTLSIFEKILQNPQNETFAQIRLEPTGLRFGKYFYPFSEAGDLAKDLEARYQDILSSPHQQRRPLYEARLKERAVWALVRALKEREGALKYQLSIQP